MSPKGRFSNQARYLLGITLRESRHEDAIAVFEEIRAVEKDKAVLDEALLAGIFASAGRRCGCWQVDLGASGKLR